MRCPASGTRGSRFSGQPRTFGSSTNVNSIIKAYNNGCRGQFPAEILAIGDIASGDHFGKSHNLWRLL